MTASVVEAVSGLVDSDAAGALVTVVAGPDFGAKAVVLADGSLAAGALPSALESVARADAAALIAREQSSTLGYEGGLEVFYEVISPRPRLFVFGAVHIAQELVDHSALAGYQTVVADPRPAFVTAERFPTADELRVGWPNEVCDDGTFDERTFVVVLTHDRRFEDPLWPIVLPSPARYIGAMGSAKTTARRRDRLLAAGFTENQVDRIHGPIGLKIGARTASETAVAILGEMIAARYSVDEPVVLAGTPMRA